MSDKLKTTTRQQVVNAAPAAWARQYQNYDDAHFADVGKKLANLAKPIKAEDVDRIIGNESWTRLSCDACDEAVGAVVHIGSGEREQSVCEACLVAGLKALGRAVMP